MDGVEDENEERRPRRTFSGHLVVVLLSGSFRFQDQTTCSLLDVIKLRLDDGPQTTDDRRSDFVYHRQTCKLVSVLNFSQN
jgi:hypothetical protein